MRKYSNFSVLLVVVVLVTACASKPISPLPGPSDEGQSILFPLPTPQYDSPISVEKALLERRSVRAYQSEPLTLAEVSQLLWAAQGITDPDGLRTSPSAGALYPLEIYILVGNVRDLEAGIYHYLPENHALALISTGDRRQALYEAALDQQALLDAAAVILITAVYDRTKQKYGERGIRYALIEAGCVTQNLYLQAESLDLGTVFIGAFEDEAVRQLVGAGIREQPLGLMPVGRK
jgi:SagB-type dehydrogenase family enzyme